MSKKLIFSTSTETLSVNPDAVVYINADGNYSVITMADGGEYVLTMQLGQIERRIAEQPDVSADLFIRIGKSLIVNHEFITFVNPARQKLILSDGRTFRYETTASREALKALKEYIEKAFPVVIKHS